MSDCLNVHKSWNAGQRYVPDPVHISVGSCLSDGATRKLIAELKSNTRQNILVLKGWFTTKFFKELFFISHSQSITLQNACHSLKVIQFHGNLFERLFRKTNTAVKPKNGIFCLLRSWYTSKWKTFKLKSISDPNLDIDWRECVPNDNIDILARPQKTTES